MGRHSTAGSTIARRDSTPRPSKKLLGSPAYNGEEAVLGRRDPMIRRVDEPPTAAEKATLKRLGLIGGAILGSVVVVASFTNTSSSSSSETLSYTPEAAVLNGCQGASSSDISKAQYIGDTSNGSEKWAVPWSDSTGHTYAAYVLEASPTAPADHIGTYRAMDCHWVNAGTMPY